MSANLLDRPGRSARTAALWAALALGAAALLALTLTRPPGPVVPSGPVVASLQPGTEAPDVGLSALDGQTVTLRQHRGQYVLLAFLDDGEAGTALAGGVATLARERGAVSLGVIRMKPAEQRRWLRESGGALTLLHDAMGVAGQAFQIDDAPALFIIDPTGKIAYRSEQPLATEENVSNALAAGTEVLPAEGAVDTAGRPDQK